MKLNMIVRSTNNKPYLAYFKELGEENYAYVHENATINECKKLLLSVISIKFRLKAAESEFLNPEDKVALTITI